MNSEGNIKTTSACASDPRARLCFLPLMWSSQATLSFRVQSQTWGDVKTSPRQRLGTCNNHHLAVKTTLLVFRRCTGNDDTFSNPVLDINPVIAFHKRRSLDVRLAEVLDLIIGYEIHASREKDRDSKIGRKITSTTAASSLSALSFARLSYLYCM